LAASNGAVCAVGYRGSLYGLFSASEIFVRRFFTYLKAIAAKGSKVIKYVYICRTALIKPDCAYN